MAQPLSRRRFLTVAAGAIAAAAAGRLLKADRPPPRRADFPDDVAYLDRLAADAVGRGSARLDIPPGRYVLTRTFVVPRQIRLLDGHGSSFECRMTHGMAITASV